MYYISDDKTKLRIPDIMRLLSQSYWAKERDEKTVRLSVENSLCFAAYTEEGRQIAFARVITDLATSYYLCDVIVDEEFRGEGIGKALVERIAEDERLKYLHGILATGDAHGLYAKFGFKTDSSRYMGRRLKRENPGKEESKNE
jgi:GNAT superfamily N-acetyltransferase